MLSLKKTIVFQRMHNREHDIRKCVDWETGLVCMIHDKLVI